MNIPTMDGESDLLKLCQELTKELEKCRLERDEARFSLNICVGAAGVGDSSELCGWIDNVKKERDEAQARLKRIRCIYCNSEYDHSQAAELADHIMSCEKSPLVQMVKEME